LFGWVSAKEPSFALGKVFVPQDILWYKILVSFFGGKKQKLGGLRRTDKRKNK